MKRTTVMTAMFQAMFFVAALWLLTPVSVQLQWPVILWILVWFLLQRTAWWLHIGATLLLGLQVDILSNSAFGLSVGIFALAQIWIGWWNQRKGRWKFAGLGSGGVAFCLTFLWLWGVRELPDILTQILLVTVFAAWQSWGRHEV